MRHQKFLPTFGHHLARAVRSAVSDPPPVTKRLS
jgi:hypothetical protein